MLVFAFEKPKSKPITIMDEISEQISLFSSWRNNRDVRLRVVVSSDELMAFLYKQKSQ